jgi:KTSC domain
MKPVKSGAIASIGHDSESQTLRIEFVNGSTYEYPDVSSEDHQALAGAKSIGKHFMATFRDRQDYRKLA